MGGDGDGGEVGRGQRSGEVSEGWGCTLELMAAGVLVSLLGMRFLKSNSNLHHLFLGALFGLLRVRRTLFGHLDVT